MGEHARGVHKRAPRRYLDAGDLHLLHVRHHAVWPRCRRAPSRECCHPRVERGLAAVAVGRFSHKEHKDHRDCVIPSCCALGGPPATRRGGGVDRKPQGTALRHVYPRRPPLLASCAASRGMGLDSRPRRHVHLLHPRVHEQAHGNVFPVPCAGSGGHSTFDGRQPTTRRHSTFDGRTPKAMPCESFSAHRCRGVC